MLALSGDQRGSSVFVSLVAVPTPKTSVIVGRREYIISYLPLLEMNLFEIRQRAKYFVIN
jgi:hypothetical protein